MTVRRLAAWLLAAVASVQAHAGEELRLQGEYPLEGMAGGNLSALARCDGQLWAVSDRDDQWLYRLQPHASVWQAEAQPLQAPPPPATALTWGLAWRNRLSGLVRGGVLDFEGLSCDAAGNRYVLSEAYSAVLRVTPQGQGEWLAIASSVFRLARASGLLLDYNALAEGLAVSADGQRLWLAAEQRRRGLLGLQSKRSGWGCSEACVLLAEGGEQQVPAELGGEPEAIDFSDIVWRGDKLFTLERQAHQFCRRDAHSAQVERCWSYAATALAAPRLYPGVDYGTAEALWLDDDAAWIGIDNNEIVRADGEARPVLWQFAAPAGGWEAS